MQLIWNLDSLRAVDHALAAADAMVGLAESRDCLIIACEVQPAGLPVTRILSIRSHGPLSNAFVVMLEDSGNINAVRTWHTVFAGGA